MAVSKTHQWDLILFQWSPVVQLVSGIDKAVDTLEWPEPGSVPGAEEIKAQIEAIDAQVDALLTERDGYSTVLNSYQGVSQEDPAT